MVKNGVFNSGLLNLYILSLDISLNTRSNYFFERKYLKIVYGWYTAHRNRIWSDDQSNQTK